MTNVITKLLANALQDKSVFVITYKSYILGLQVIYMYAGGNSAEHTSRIINGTNYLIFISYKKIPKKIWHR